jgi:GNAT superfamily N-acetyltransferase
MVLEVIEQNHSAVHLYQKCGFTIVRRLIGLIRRDAVEEGQTTLEEMDIREIARLILRDGLADLPWQLSGESIALMSPPARAYRRGPACVVISNPEAKDIAIWSLLVEPASRGNALGTALLRALIAQHPGKTWHVPALMPEELGQAYERAGFVREELSQWQMSLLL